MSIEKKLGSWMTCAFLFGVAPSAIAFDLKQNFYLGGGLGGSQYDLSSIEDLADSDDNSIYEDESEAVAFSLMAGWNFTDSFSGEFVYMDFGSWETTEEDIDPESGMLDARWQKEGKISGFGFAIRYDLAMSSNFDAYARLGMLSWEMDIESVDDYYYYDEFESSTTGFDGTDLFLTLGLRYALNDKIFLFAEATALDSALEENFGDGDTLNEDFGVISVVGGVQYYFSAPIRKRIDGSVVKAETEQSRDITACDPKYRDISGIMCDQ